MHYLTRDAHTIIVETDDHAERLEVDGWQRITEAEYVRRWRYRDLVRLHQLRREAAPKERAVGDTL
jgi:hypothetical protein